METRNLPAEVKLERREDGGAVIRGRGAVYYRKDDPGTEYELWPGVVERIMPGAFDDVIGGDVRSFFNHDSNFVLGRTKSGTLKLSLDRRGLTYEITPPDTQAVRDHVIAPLERGDVDGSSFMFMVGPGGQRWLEEDRDGTIIEVREITRVSELYEVGPVSLPAYKSTSAGVGRAAGDLAEARSALEAARQARRSDAEAVAVQARWVEVQEAEKSH